MTALTAKAALVDPTTFEGGEGVIATSIPRSEIEEALGAGTTSELFLDVARERDGEREAEHRITVSWEPDDLEKLLSSTTGDEVTFAFSSEELARMFDEPDVEAQGLRERMAILTVAATTAAGIAAGVAGAMPMNASGEGGAPAAQAAFVTDTTSSGPQASTEAGTVSNLVTDTTSSGPQGTEAASGGQFVTDATSSGPQASTEAGTVSNLVTDATSSGPREVAQTASASGGGGESFIESTGGQAVLAGGLVLLILGAGFLGTRQRRGVQPA